MATYAYLRGEAMIAMPKARAKRLLGDLATREDSVTNICFTKNEVGVPPFFNHDRERRECKDLRLCGWQELHNDWAQQRPAWGEQCTTGQKEMGVVLPPAPRTTRINLDKVKC